MIKYCVKCAGQNLALPWLHIPFEFCSSASLEAWHKILCLWKWLSHISRAFFNLPLPHSFTISQLWPLPFSFKLSFITVFSASWQLFCFSALKNLPPYWPLCLNSVPASTFTHKYLNAVVYTCWISSSVIKIIQVYCGEKKIECFVMSNNSLKWFSLQV